MKVKRIIFLFLLIIVCVKNVVYGNHATNLDIEFYVKDSKVYVTDPLKSSAEYEEKLLNNLKSYLNYTGDTINKEMKFDTSIKIIKRSNNGKFNIQIGSDDGNITIEGVKEDDLQKIYGCLDPTSDNPWRAVLVVSCYTASSTSETVISIDYKFKINEIYNSYDTDDYAAGQNLQIQSEKLEAGANTGDFVQGAKAAYNAVKSYSEFMKKFGEDPGGVIAKGIANFLKDIADVVQALVNKIQTVFDGIPFDDFSLVYSYSDLTSTGTNMTAASNNKVDYSVLNKYTKVGNPSNTLSNNQKYIINIDNKIDKFSTQTKIPVIPVDICGFAFEKMDIFDVDFLQINHKTNKSTIWNLMRQIFSTTTHLVLFFSIAVLLSTLIYHGIHIIKSINDNPKGRDEHIKGLYRFMSSLIILTVVILFIALCTTFNNYLLETIRGKNIIQDDELPIRVNVDNVYSFSTNVTGYFKFMSESEDESKNCTYTIEYVIMVGINVFVVGLMIFRSLKMWILGMAGPIIAATNAMNVQEQIGFKLTLKDWTKSYAMLASIQLLITVFYSIIEYSIVNVNI